MGVTNVSMRLKRKIAVENHYSGNGWNFEKTTKYVFEMNGMMLEAGYFEHYLGDEFVKAVIELPVSYGCPAHCRFCASSAINDFIKLESEQMKQLLDYIWSEHELDDNEYILLSITGTGDLYFNFSNVKRFLGYLSRYKNLHITVSSCFWTPDNILEIDRLSGEISFRNVQITYISDRQKVLSSIVPAYLHREVNFEEVLQYLKDSECKYYRINYIMIKDVNDSEKDFRRFIEKIKHVKNKIVVRISKLNETKAAERNALCTAEMERARLLEKMLMAAGIKCYLFYAVKNDHMNCGQLVTEY